MAIKLVDELKAMGNFPIAHAEGINLVKTDGTEDNLQNLFNNGELGGGDDSVTLTQQEYEALAEEQKLDGLYYTYDTKRIYKNGIQYGASEPIPLTMEEYKALKEAGAIDEQQEYLIEANTEGILLGAEDIGYSNAVSNLPCTTVQGAIDKVVEKIHSYFYPTGVITDIELGENGDIYIAPSDGFVQVTITGIGYASIITSNAANSVSTNSLTDNNHRTKTFVKKDEEYRVYYSGADKSLITLKHYALV